MPQKRKSKSDRIDDLEAAWALAVRVLAFILGAAILIGLTFFVDNRPIYAWLAGIALCGPTVAASVATMLDSVQGVLQAARGDESP